MATVYVRAYMEEQSGQEAGPIRFVASTEQVARDGLVVEASAWRLENYNRNPVFLWVHDYRSLPIGRAKARVEGNQLIAEVEFDQEDPFARQVESKYRRGFLNAVSVGWNTLDIQPGAGRMDAPRVTEADLLDISAVPVPSDPMALKERQARGLEELRDQLGQILDEPEDGQDWEITAIGMMRLYHPAAGTLSEQERRRTYNRLAAQYRRMGRTAPEYLKAEELDGLGLSELQGLFLEDEPDMLPGWFAEERAGAVLSARNRNDLEEATRLIQGVIERASKEPEPETAPERSQAETTRTDGPEVRAVLEQIANLLPKG